MEALKTLAEREASKAEDLNAFSGVKLNFIRSQIAILLSLIGRHRIFDQYTRHDITHIDAMLKSLEWIIPESTKKQMSPADWLMITLSIYFHDLGMLVTQREYEDRKESDFNRFKEETLFSGINGKDYREKVFKLGEESSERFFYQEFVRHKHAERIKYWILGQQNDNLGKATECVTEIGKLLANLGPQFRRDLGLICESHHQNDLDNVKKYKISQPYGNSLAETVNMQYCAVLLRTADLLHITTDRTPSIEFKTINPTDPISQQEWAKQLAVKCVRPKHGLNDEGLPDEAAPKDCIEVFAYFTKEDGFFGLTSYLSYAAEQLKKSNEWLTTTNKQKLSSFEFPWRRIDDANIETEGFIRDAFEFTIDQAKVLDLLTGHTLYNDTNVVLRELVQNSIDAIRLQSYPDRATKTGKVNISWNSADRVLTVQDNGTGMTQQMINNFLLKVGSSRYQDPEFRKRYPGFSSISRFGIGVLSTFMIADVVEILTCHPDDEQARQLTLRSVHGKYLIRTIDKSKDEIKALGSHGTKFRLTLRPSIEMADILESAIKWIVVPDCEVAVTIDDRPLTRVGFDSPREALIDILRKRGISVDDATSTEEPIVPSTQKVVRVIEQCIGNVTLAYALEWSNYFREWSFVTDIRRERNKLVHLGTCIEGIRVEFTSPGYLDYQIAAIANVTGQNAPKTNVARSGLEVTPERDAMLRAIYELYGRHVVEEMRDLYDKRMFSLTWASQEAEYLLGSLTRRDNAKGAVSPALLDRALRDLKILVVEKDKRRETCSAAELGTCHEFWTIDCGLIRSSELLMREVRSEATLGGLLGALGIRGFDIPSVVLCESAHKSIAATLAFEDREVDKIVIYPDQRRVDLRWVKRSTPSRWIIADRQAELVNFILTRGLFHSPVMLGSQTIEIVAPPDITAVSASGTFFVLPGTKIAEAAKKYMELIMSSGVFEERVNATAALSVIISMLRSSYSIDDPEQYIINHCRELEQSFIKRTIRIEDSVDLSELATLIRSRGKYFNTSAWLRGGQKQIMLGEESFG